MSEEQKDKEEGGKVEKKYLQNMQQLKAILGDRPLGFPTKLDVNSVTLKEGQIPQDEKDMDEIVRTLFQEENNALKEEVKTELRSLLKKHVEFEKEVSKKENELKGLKTQKKKDFNEECKKLFGKISGVEVRIKQLRQSLQEGMQEIPDDDAKPDEQIEN